MTASNREARVLEAVVTLVDSLLDGFDVVELLTDLTERSAELLDVESAGLLLADPRGRLHLMAATTDQAQEVELFQLQTDEGPCRDCYLSGAPVSAPDLSRESNRWPAFAAAAAAMGLASVHALPMRAAGTVLGALGLFGTRPGDLGEADLLVGQSLAHVATVAIVQEHSPTADVVLPHLRSALASRVVVEQAKGFLYESLGVDLTAAFALLRSYARSNDTGVTDVSRQLIHQADERAALLAQLVAHHRPASQSDGG